MRSNLNLPLAALSACVIFFSCGEQTQQNNNNTQQSNQTTVEVDLPPPAEPVPAKSITISPTINIGGAKSNSGKTADIKEEESSNKQRKTTGSSTAH